MITVFNCFMFIIDFILHILENHGPGVGRQEENSEH